MASGTIPSRFFAQGRARPDAPAYYVRDGDPWQRVSWKRYVDKVNSGALLNSLKAQQLNQLMMKIPNRKLKDAANRIVGQGDMIMGKLKNLENNLRKIPKDALAKWKGYVDAINTGKLLNGIRAQQLGLHRRIHGRHATADHHNIAANRQF